MSTANNNLDKVQETEVHDLDELLGTKASTVLIPDDGAGKNTVLKSTHVDMSFIDNQEEEEEQEEELDEEGNVIPKTTSPKSTSETLDSILDEELEEEEEEEEEDQQQNNRGRSKLTKDIMVVAAQKLFDKGVLTPFEGDERPLSEYTAQDWEELIEENIKQKVAKTAEEAPLRVFQDLSEDVQKVLVYALNGGTDTKTIFKVLAQSQETYELSLEKEEDQERIVREWLVSTQFGSSEEIEDEIVELKDRGSLLKKAELFKPKLDAKQATIIQDKLAKQTAAAAAAQEQAKKYTQSIYNTLAKGSLGDVKLNTTTQNLLYHGLIGKEYVDRTGSPTNMLGHLLEEYQFGENQNLELVAEALWLLKNPAEYRENVKKLGAVDREKQVMKKLKTEQNLTNSSSSNIETPDGTSNTNKKPGIKKPVRNVFSRS